MKARLMHFMQSALVGLLLAGNSFQVAKAEPPTPSRLVWQGEALYKSGQLLQAEAVLQTAIPLWDARKEWQPLATTLANLGRIQYLTGRSDDALESLERSLSLYEGRPHVRAEIARLKIYRARAFQALGLHPRACSSLIEALTTFAANRAEPSTLAQLCEDRGLLVEDLAFVASPNPLQVSGWQTLADVFRETGRLEESSVILESILVQPLHATERDAIALSLGNTYKAIGDRDRERLTPTQFEVLPWRCQDTTVPLDAGVENIYGRAQELYRQVAHSDSAVLRAKSQLNQRALAAVAGKTTAFEAIDLSVLPPGRARIYARILAAKTRVCLAPNPDWPALIDELQRAATAARLMGDLLAEAEVIGNLGSLYEYRAWLQMQASSTPEVRQWQIRALELSQQALTMAQSARSSESTYQWQWQQGRLLLALGRQPEAVVAYEAAIESLEAVRGDLIAVNSDVQFSFRDRVEPVYRELIALLLDSSRDDASEEDVERALLKSLYYVESLQLVELENFLQCDLETLGVTALAADRSDLSRALSDRIESIFEVDPHAALIYPILLKDSIAVFYQLPGQPLRYHLTSLDTGAREFEAVLENLQTLLQRFPHARNEIRELSGQLYQWIIAPIEAELDLAAERDRSDVKTLTFVLDGGLRNIPMSLLYDEERDRHLLERYAIAVAPSLQTLNLRRSTGSIEALLAGLSEEREFPGQPPFSALENVPKELDAIAAIVPSEKLLDLDFVKQKISQSLGANPYSILHIATHGNFSSDPENTFVLLSDGLLQVREFDELLQLNRDERAVALELLVLSACETAKGDRRAALGLAGIALRAGAKSTLATLWKVDDASTSVLMSGFYRIWRENPSITKAEALRLAQLELWNNRSQEWGLPFYWSPFVIVGNWL